MKLIPLLLSVAALALLPSCGVNVGIGYNGVSASVTFPQRVPLPANPSTEPPGKNPVLPAP